MESNVILSATVEASGAVAAHRAVTFTRTQATTLGEKVHGVSRTNASDGQSLTVDVIGYVIVQSGGAVSLGDELVTDTQGRAVVNPTVGGEYVFAEAVEAASGADKLIKALLR